MRGSPKRSAPARRSVDAFQLERRVLVEDLRRGSCHGHGSDSGRWATRRPDYGHRRLDATGNRGFVPQRSSGRSPLAARRHPVGLRRSPAGFRSATAGRAGGHSSGLHATGRPRHPPPSLASREECPPRIWPSLGRIPDLLCCQWPIDGDCGVGTGRQVTMVGGEGSEQTTCLRVALQELDPRHGDFCEGGAVVSVYVVHGFR